MLLKQGRVGSGPADVSIGQQLLHCMRVTVLSSVPGVACMALARWPDMPPPSLEVQWFCACIALNVLRVRTGNECQLRAETGAKHNQVLKSCYRTIG